MTARRGFALLIVMWTIVGATALAFGSSARARTAVLATRNRVHQRQAYWRATECMARARAAIVLAIWPEGYDARQVRDRWSHLDRTIRTGVLGVPPDCAVNIAPAGLSANANSITSEGLDRLLASAGVSARRADSLRDALMDWRDADDVPREHGAERAWYAAQRLSLPRNGPLLASEELAAVRGFSESPELLAMLGVEEERILWRRAPLPVLASLPAMSREALGAFGRRRDQLDHLPGLLDFPDLGGGAREEFARRVPQLSQRVIDEPEAWIVTASAVAGIPPIQTTVQARYGMGARHLVILRQEVR